MTIEIAGLSKTYSNGTRALKGVTWSFGQGTAGLLGPNGSGKTTLMRILATLLRPTSGRVTIFGHPVENAAEVRRLLGYLPQTFGFYPQLTVWETLEYFAHLKGVERPARLAELLEIVGLAEHRKTRTGGLSGGMRQRLGIAVALLNDPKLLIVDEPTSGLDPEGRVQFRNLLTSLPGERTVIISSHIVEDMTQTASHLAVLLEGRLLFTGRPAELAEKAGGRVWEGRVKVSDLGEFSRTHYVVSSVREGDELTVRCIGPGGSGLRAVTPTLEDGFIVTLREGRSRCTDS